MDNGSYVYATLAKKHDNFTAPGFEIEVDGKPLPPGRYNIPGVEVEITSGGTAGGCYFTIEGQYDFENHKWVNDAAKYIKPGAKLSVLGGYVERKSMFFGYVDEYSLDFKDDGTPCISVTGMDATGYLMNRYEPIYAGQKKPKEIVETILKKCKSAGFAKKVTVGTLNGFETPIIKEQMSDWEFLKVLGQRYGASLFVINGELIFDNVLKKTAPILTLTVGKSVGAFSRRVSLAHQVGKVEIQGRDVNFKPIKGTASTVTTGGDGKSAAQWVTGLRDAVLRERSEFVRTQKECELLAQNKLNSIAMGFVSGEGECIGIPELIPGRYIKIDGGDDTTNGTYFLTRVIHSFTMGHYITSFEVKGAKA